MAANPYAGLPSSAYWRSAVADADGEPAASWCQPKWEIPRSARIATAGSCFAQHIGRRLSAEGFTVVDVEPAPTNLPARLHMEHGYGIYSARYGNVYTARQMLQLAEEATGRRPKSEEVWAMGDRFVDALRPTIDPEGHGTPAAVIAHRRRHLRLVHYLLASTDLLVFTLGLTETWENVQTGRVYPVCPGTVAGEFDPALYRFKNLTFTETLNDFIALRKLLQRMRGGRDIRFLLTVSPVPLTATASGQHVVPATIYSKSVLRAVAGELVAMFDDVDYFPSYEIVASPWSPQRRYAANLRSVRDSSVDLVMRTFLQAHGVRPRLDQEPDPRPDPPQVAGPAEAASAEADAAMKVKCDEELLAVFGPAA